MEYTPKIYEFLASLIPIDLMKTAADVTDIKGAVKDTLPGLLNANSGALDSAVGKVKASADKIDFAVQAMPSVIATAIGDGINLLATPIQEVTNSVGAAKDAITSSLDKKIDEATRQIICRLDKRGSRKLTEVHPRVIPIIRLLIQAQAYAMDHDAGETVVSAKNTKKVSESNENLGMSSLRGSKAMQAYKEWLSSSDLCERLDYALRDFDHKDQSYRCQRYLEIHYLIEDITAWVDQHCDIEPKG